MNEYITVFDLAEVGYRQWPSAAVGLPFVVLGALLVCDRNRLRPLSPSWLRTGFAFFFFGFSVLWTVVAFAGTYLQYRALSTALREGRVAIVEGPVENFVPMPYTGHAKESFTVGGVHFSYSDFVCTAGFNNTSSHGGPIQQGRFVRIGYVGDDIVRLEVRK